MPWTQANLDALKTQIATAGFVSEMDFGDQHVRFASIDQMRALIAEMQRDINTAAAVPVPTARYATTSKGV